MQCKFRTFYSLLLAGCMLFSGLFSCFVFAENGTLPDTAQITQFFDSLKSGLYGANGQQSTDNGKMVAAANTGVNYVGGMNESTYNRLLAQYPGGNKLYGLTPTVEAAVSGYTVGYPDGKPYNRVYDGKLTGSACLQLQLQKAGVAVPIPESAIKITYDLGAGVTPNVIIVGCTSGWNQLMQYEVYMADSLEALYHTANRVYTYDGTKFEGCNKWGNYVEDAKPWINTSQEQGLLCSAALPAAGAGRYFGVLVTRGNAASGNTVAIGEIAVLGSAVTVEQPSKEEAFFSALKSGLYGANGQQSTDNGRMVAAKNTGADYAGGMNNATYQKLLAQFSSGNKLNGLTPTIDTAKAGYQVEKAQNSLQSWLSDNEVEGSRACILNLKNASGAAANLSDSPIRLTYDLGQTVTPAVILAGGSCGWNQLLKYEVYMADSVAELYNATNRVYTYDGFQLLKADGTTALDKWGNYIDPTTYWATGGQRMMGSAVLPNGAKGRYISFVITGSNKAANTRVDLVELAVLEAGDEPAQDENTYQSFLDSLSTGLISCNTGKNDPSFGKMVQDPDSGADYCGGLNQTTYNLMKGYVGANLLEARTPEVSTAAGNKLVYKDGNYPHRAVDNVIDSSTCYQLSVENAANERVPLDQSPITLTYDLGKKVMANSIVIASARGQNQLVAYELYVSDTKEDLYNTQNRIASYDVKNSVAVNRWGTFIEDYSTWANKPADEEKGPYLAQVYNSTNAVGRYFGIKVLRQCPVVSATVDQVAFGELAFFAQPYLIDNEVTTAAAAKQKYDGGNLLKAATASVSGLSLNPAGLKDGNYAALVSCNETAGEVAFTLDQPYIIDRFMLAGLADDTRLKQYEIYTALDRDELFDAKNRQVSHAADDSVTGSGVLTNGITLNTPVKARYIGFRFVSANGGVKLYELGAYGEKLPPYTVTTQVMPNSEAKTYATERYGKNRLVKAKLEAEHVHNAFGYTAAALNDDKYEPLYFERDKEGRTPILTFTLRNEIIVQDLAVVSVGNPYGKGNIRLGEYELYLSNQKETLYNAENLAAHVVGSTHTVMDMSSVFDLIHLSQGKTAKYFGIKILKDNLSDEYVGIRMTELAVFGNPPSASLSETQKLLGSLKNGLLNADGKNDLSLGKAVSDIGNGPDFNGGLNQPTYQAIDDLYRNKNLLSGKVPEITVDNGYTLYSDDGTPQRLTDGVIRGDVTYAIQAKNQSNNTVPFSEANVYLTYDVGKRASLELLTLAGSRAEQYQQYKYKIYVSDSKENLYSAENLAVIYDCGTSTLTNGRVLPLDPYAKAADEKTGYKPLMAQYYLLSGTSGRYVGIRLCGTANEENKVCLGEIGLWAARDVYNPELDNYGLYAEQLYNIIENGDFESEISAENWGTLQSGFERVREKAAASHGEYLLNAAAPVQQTWHFTVKPDTEYTFAISAKAAGTAKAQIRLSYNEGGAAFENVVPGTVSASLIDTTMYIADTNNTWQRMGYSFSSGEHTDVYLTISGVAGTVALDDIMLFRADYGFEKDPNDYSVMATGYVGNVPMLDADESLRMEMDLNGASPETGDVAHTAPAVAMVLFGLALCILYGLKREGNKNEAE